jgi:hypothetical protein
VAPIDETPLQDVDSIDDSAPATSLWQDAWRTLRTNPLFIVSALLILFIIFVALFPGVFTKQNPNYCNLDNSLNPPSNSHPFGFDMQGCDVFTRTVYGTRTSLSVGILATVLVVLLGALIGAIGRLLRRLDRCRPQPTDRYLLGAADSAWRDRGAADVPHLVINLEDRAGDDPVRLGVHGPHRARRGDGGEEPRIQHRLHGAGLDADAQPDQPHHPQLHGPDHRDRHHVAGHLHRA